MGMIGKHCRTREGLRLAGELLRLTGSARNNVDGKT